MPDIETLVALARAADADLASRHEAFGQLVALCQDMAYGYAYSMLGDASLAQDAAQESFLVAYRELERLREPAAFPAWLRRIVLSQCVRMQRRAHYHQEQDIESVADLPDDRDRPAEVAEHMELREALHAAIQALPESERTATVLCYVDGYSQAEIASFLEVPAPTVRKRIERARTRLREAMIDMVKDNLSAERPSRDGEFVQKVQLAVLLDEAGAQGEFAALEALLLDGIDVNWRGEHGRTLLHWAVRRRSAEAVELLVRHGADVNAHDGSGATPAQEAARLGAREIARYLREHGGHA
ncbi:MAG: sigma-70 family RNA polymerase sigma factor [Anaerolineae bacterium]